LEAVADPEIILGDLSLGMPGITPTFGATLAEAATVCLEAQSHSSGVRMEVDGDYGTGCAVRWGPVGDPAQAKRCWADPEVATEHGAYGVASLLVSVLTDLTVVERSRKGTGFDYWLGKKEETEPLFQNKARLEVSGIAKGSLPEIGKRAQQKLKQTKQSDSTKLPAIVAVVEFSAPRSRLVKK
jgi:hypothetical protein